MFTEDGCAVEVYLALPTMGEPELVHAAAPAGASVLDLGCGVGRIAHPLIALGHEVVGVDSSAEMLAHCRFETVQAQIADLDLPRRFDVVLLASNLVHSDDRAELLASAARHLAPGGTVIGQWHPPAWFDQVHDASGRMGDVATSLRVISYDHGVLEAVASYEVAGTTYDQVFTAERLSEGALTTDLAAVGLDWDGWLSDDCSWWRATA